VGGREERASRREGENSERKKGKILHPAGEMRTDNDVGGFEKGNHLRPAHHLARPQCKDGLRGSELFCGLKGKLGTGLRSRDSGEGKSGGIHGALLKGSMIGVEFPRKVVPLAVLCACCIICLTGRGTARERTPRPVARGECNCFATLHAGGSLLSLRITDLILVKGCVVVFVRSRCHEVRMRGAHRAVLGTVCQKLTKAGSHDLLRERSTSR